MARARKETATEAIGPIGNGAEETILSKAPYTVRFTIRGTADLIFHRWQCESIAAKTAAAKGSKAKRSDDLESYVYRDEKGFVCLPGEYLRMSMIDAGRYRQDPRSPRKSAKDLLKAALIPLTALAPVGPTPSKKWGFDFATRCVVQRQGITRVRPAFRSGWEATFDFMCLLPEYVNPDFFHDLLVDAGRLCGTAEFRPTYGRYAVARFDVL